MIIFTDPLYSLASYPRVYSSSMSSHGKHCLSADSEARWCRAPSAWLHALPGQAAFSALLQPCTILIPPRQKSFAVLITQGQISSCKHHAASPL
jgi:hypothetical protein